MKALVIAPVAQWQPLRDRLYRLGIQATYFINAGAALELAYSCVTEVDLVIMDAKEVPESLFYQIRALEQEAHIRVILPNLLEEEVEYVAEGGCSDG